MKEVTHITDDNNQDITIIYHDTKIEQEQLEEVQKLQEVLGINNQNIKQFGKVRFFILSYINSNGHVIPTDELGQENLEIFKNFNLKRLRLLSCINDYNYSIKTVGFTIDLDINDLIQLIDLTNGNIAISDKEILHSYESKRNALQLDTEITAVISFDMNS